MKSTIFSPLAISLLLGLGTLCADACGPYTPKIPTPEFFALKNYHKNMVDYEKAENIRLWQSLTSPQIPLADIEKAVYKTSYDQITFEDTPDNLFFTYLDNTNDTELRSLLLTAKQMEGQWNSTRSPWYYPAHRNSADDAGDFQEIIDRCNAYEGSRLKDRYGLQAVRAYFASRRYADCIHYYDSVFTAFPDDNLMKRMATRYAAGCWSRLGDAAKADSMFAVAGDVWSISADNRLEYMAQHNPAAPQLMEYIRSQAADTAFLKEAAALAEKVVADKRVTNKGDWHFLLAYANNELLANRPAATAQIRRALSRSFSTDELANLARAYKMKLDAQNGNRSSLLADLKWIETKADAMNPEANQWIRRLENIVYTGWVPNLWQRGDYPTAILLCAYADNFSDDRAKVDAWEKTLIYSMPTTSLTKQQMRSSRRYDNLNDYACLSFQLMGSLTSSQLANAYNNIMADTPLFNHLRKKARTDRDYYYELIGTLALREENFDRAINYLSTVSSDYQQTMNIFKYNYLARDPFVAYPTRWEESDFGYEYEYRRSSRKSKYPQLDAKLNFAKKMKALAKQITGGATPDDRGLARLNYAIGRRNSLEECWALTQYWRGECTGKFEPDLNYWNDDYAENNYAFLYDYPTSVGHEATEKHYAAEIAAAKAMLRTDEARARAEHILGNNATVVRRYANTATAQLIKTSCDNWQNWL